VRSHLELVIGRGGLPQLKALASTGSESRGPACFPALCSARSEV